MAALPNSGGCWRQRCAAMLPIAIPFLKNIQEENWQLPSPGMISWTSTSFDPTWPDAFDEKFLQLIAAISPPRLGLRSVKEIFLDCRLDPQGKLGIDRVNIFNTLGAPGAGNGDFQLLGEASRCSTCSRPTSPRPRPEWARETLSQARRDGGKCSHVFIARREKNPALQVHAEAGIQEERDRASGSRRSGRSD